MKRDFIIMAFFILFTTFITAEEVSFSAHTVTTGLIQASAVDVGDINGDGYQDLVTTALGGNGEVSWWENDGNQSFTKIPITNQFDGARSVKVIDIDGNGTDDIIAAGVYANKIILWKNDGTGNLTRCLVDTTFLGPHTVDIKDVNNDGHLDVLCSGTSQNNSQREAAWWENDGEENFTKHLISDQFEKSCFIEGAYINDDEFMDILVCDEEQGDVIWFENNGSHEFNVQHVVDNNYPYIHTTVARDIDKDGDLDILGTVTYASKLAWWENIGNGNFSSRNHIANLGGAIWVDTMDMDKDGDLDMVTAAMGENYLNWWENDGSQNFTKHSLSGYCRGGFGFAMKDIDGDSDKDIAAVGFNSNRLIWLENTSPLSVNESRLIPSVFKLKQNYPNPFNPSTQIKYNLQKRGFVSLEIYNAVGQKVKTLINSEKSVGEHQIRWYGTDDQNKPVSSGIYMYQLKTGNQIQTRKMILIR